MKNITRTWLWLSIFSISMAALESAVVVYLRALFYGERMELFPLQPLSEHLLWVELTRELATLLMLLSVGVMLGKNRWSRMGYFLAAFGIWDIFYYVFLYVFLQWPESIVSWDILFLISLPWFGPVLAPCLVSVLFILFGIICSLHEDKGDALRIRFEEWTGMILGTLTMLYTFMEESLHLLFSGKINSADPMILREMAEYIPQDFSWGIFTCGILLFAGGVFVYYRRIRLSHLVLY